MKKILCLLLAVLLVCGLWGCNNPISDVPQNDDASKNDSQDSTPDEPFPYKLIVLGKDITQGNEKYLKMDADGRRCEIPLLAVLRELGVQIYRTKNEIIGIYKGVYMYWEIRDGIFLPDNDYVDWYTGGSMESKCWSRVEEDEIVVDSYFLSAFLTGEIKARFGAHYDVHCYYNDLTVKIVFLEEYSKVK